MGKILSEYIQRILRKREGKFFLTLLVSPIRKTAVLIFFQRASFRSFRFLYVHC